MEFLEEGFAVAVDGSFAEVHEGGDLFVGVFAAGVGEEEGFLGGEPGALGLKMGGGEAAEAYVAGICIVVALGADFFQGFFEFGGVCVFEEVGAAAGFEHVDDGVVFIVHGEGDELHGGVLGGEPLGGGDAVHDGHVDIDEHHGRHLVVLCHFLPEVVAVEGFDDDFVIAEAFEHEAEGFEEELVVVDEADGCFHMLLFVVGKMMVTRVPDGGGVVQEMEPPRSWVRCCMLISPMPVGALVGRPEPLSWMQICNCWWCSVVETRMWVACACLRAFWMAS